MTKTSHPYSLTELFKAIKCFQDITFIIPVIASTELY